MSAIEPFVATIPGNHCHGPYKALAVRQGMLTVPVALYEGRLCYLAGEVRVQHVNKQWGRYNRVTVRFLDDGSSQSIPAGQWAKKAKNAPLPPEAQQA